MLYFLFPGSTLSGEYPIKIFVPISYFFINLFTIISSVVDGYEVLSKIIIVFFFIFKKNLLTQFFIKERSGLLFFNGVGKAIIIISILKKSTF